MKHILLVEPDAQLRSLYFKSLTKAGYTVVTAADAQSAIHVSEEKQPDCIVLELQLKMHGGIEFLYELRSYPDWRSIPVIIHSFVPPRELEPFTSSLKLLGVVAAHYKPDTTMHKLMTVIEDVVPVS